MSRVDLYCSCMSWLFFVFDNVKAQKIIDFIIETLIL